jgi:hypothetical protein
MRSIKCNNGYNHLPPMVIMQIYYFRLKCDYTIFNKDKTSPYLRQIDTPYPALSDNFKSGKFQ